LLLLVVITQTLVVFPEYMQSAFNEPGILSIKGIAPDLNKPSLSLHPGLPQDAKLPDVAHGEFC
jgi:hypothetical protein